MQFPSQEALHQAAHDLTVDYLQRIVFPQMAKQGQLNATPQGYARIYAERYRMMVNALRNEP